MRMFLRLLAVSLLVALTAGQELALGANSRVRLTSDRPGLRLQPQPAAYYSTNEAATRVTLVSVCELDGEEAEIPGRCLTELTHPGPWDWELTDTTVDGLRTSTGELSVPLAGNLQACPDGTAHSFQDGRVTFTVGTSSGNALKIVDSISGDVSGSLAVLSSGSVQLNVDASGWPFCHTSHHLQVRLEVQDAGSQYGRKQHVRRLSDVRTELEGAETSFAAKLRAGADTLLATLSDDLNLTKAFCEAEEQQTPSDDYYCRNESSQIAHMLRDVACTHDTQMQPSAEEMIECYAPGGRPLRSAAAGGHVSGCPPQARRLQQQTTDEHSGGRAGCQAVSDDTDKRYGRIPGVGRPPSAGDGSLAVIPAGESLDLNIVTPDMALVDGAPTPMGYQLQESNADVAVVLTIPHFQGWMSAQSFVAVSAAASADQGEMADLLERISRDTDEAEERIFRLGVLAGRRLEAAAKSTSSMSAGAIAGIVAAALVAVAAMAAAVAAVTLRHRESHRYQELEMEGVVRKFTALHRAVGRWATKSGVTLCHEEEYGHLREDRRYPPYLGNDSAPPSPMIETGDGNEPKVSANTDDEDDE